MGNSAILVVFGRMGPVWAPGAQNGPYSSISQWWEGYLGPTPWPGQIPLFPLSLSGGRGIWTPWGVLSGGGAKRALFSTPPKYPLLAPSQNGPFAGSLDNRGAFWPKRGQFGGPFWPNLHNLIIKYCLRKQCLIGHPKSPFLRSPGHHCRIEDFMLRGRF